MTRDDWLLVAWLGHARLGSRPGKKPLVPVTKYLRGSGNSICARRQEQQGAGQG